VITKLRNIAIIAHVDHGKTTLVDKLLQQSGTLGDRGNNVERVMDSNELEKERGITILSKNTALHWQDYRINIVDTPGHADFGGEVERVLSMVDSVLLLVDAVEGPMPQTRFVTQKALVRGLRPIVVINKIDRDGARPDWVLDQTFELFDRLRADDAQLDFPVIYASALNGYASFDSDDPDEPFQLQVSALDYSSYVGVIGIGRINSGRIKTNSPIVIVNDKGKQRQGRILQILGFHGLERIERSEASAGDIIAFTGVDKLNISDTLCDPEHVIPLPALTVDEPTVSMTFQVNTSPFAGKEGKYVTSRQIRERLQRELLHNVALRVSDTDDPDKFLISGRGELHLGILIENMRRENYELAVSRPKVIIKEIEGERCEPYESLTVDVEQNHQGTVIELLGVRQAELLSMQPDGKGRRTEFLTATSGTGLLYHVFERYAPIKPGTIAQRTNGVLISKAEGIKQKVKV